MEEHIIGVARKLFTEKGYTNTNMSDIAATAGIKRSTLHYYFRTKDRLFQAIYGDIVRKIIPRIQTILTQDIPFFERMNDIIDEYIALFLSDPALPRFILGEIQRDMGHLVKISQELQTNPRIYFEHTRNTGGRSTERENPQCTPPHYFSHPLLPNAVSIPHKEFGHYTYSTG